MIDKDMLIAAIAKYSNDIDNLNLEELFVELKQLSNSSEEFYEYRRLVVQSIIDDFNSETIADDIMSKNVLGDLFSGIEFNKKVIISKEQPDYSSTFGNNTFSNSTLNKGVICKLKELQPKTFHLATISGIQDLSDVEYLRNFNLSCKYNNCRVILKDIKYFDYIAFMPSDLTSMRNCKIEYAGSVKQFKHIFNESSKKWPLNQIPAYNDLQDYFHTVHCTDGEYTFKRFNDLALFANEDLDDLETFSRNWPKAVECIDGVWELKNFRG